MEAPQSTAAPAGDHSAPRLTLRRIALDLAERFFSLDRGWLRTARELSTRPGAMIRSYVGGDRTSRANPFAYLLLATAASVVVQRWIGFQEWAVESSITADTLSPAQLALTQQLGEIVQQYTLWISLGILVPFAVLLRLFFRRAGYNLAETMVFALYTGGHLALLGVITLPLTKLAGVHPAFVGLPLAFAYCSFAAVGFFGGRVATVVKTCLAYIGGFTAYGAVAMAATLAYVLTLGLPSLAAIDDWNLVSAAEQGQTEVVEQLLEGGGDPNLTLHQTALHLAAENGHLETVELLVRSGADLDALDHRGRSPAFYALRAGHLDIVQLLLDAGARAALEASDGSTLLLLAARSGETGLALRLLEAGCEVNAVRREGSTVTALMRAARSGDQAMVQLLLEHGADPSITNSEGETALDMARGRAVKKLLLAATETPPPSP